MKDEDDVDKIISKIEKDTTNLEITDLSSRYEICEDTTNLCLSITKDRKCKYCSAKNYCVSLPGQYHDLQTIYFAILHLAKAMWEDNNK